MSKELYATALAEVKQLKQVAEDNARRDVLEVVTPQIREFIENALLADPESSEDFPDGFDSEPTIGVSSTTAPANPTQTTSGVAVSPPASDGKVTLDVDALVTEPTGEPVAPPLFGLTAGPDGMGTEDDTEGEEFEVGLDSLDAVKPVVSATKSGMIDNFELEVHRMGESVKKFSKVSKLVRETRSYRAQIAKMISRVEDMYGYVQESIADSKKKSYFEDKLESYNAALGVLQEHAMNQRNRNSRLDEADVTLKLTGLPDDVDLDSVGVDLITGEDEGETAEGGDEGSEGQQGAEDSDQGGEGGDDLDLGDLDLGDEGGQQQTQQENKMRLTDDTVVEIDEGMLRREIKRMRQLREEKGFTPFGNGADHIDNFGGGKDEGEYWDADMPNKTDAVAALPLGENDEADEDQDDLDEQDDAGMDEADQDQDQMDEDDSCGMDQADQDDLDESDDDDLDQIGDRRTRDDFGGSATSSPSVDKDNPLNRESIQHKISQEKKLQERAKKVASRIKLEARKAKAAKSAKRYNEAKSRYQNVAKTFNESVKRTQSLTRLLESNRRTQAAGKNASANRLAETNTALRARLAETNLSNVKLQYTNKLLQERRLSSAQKAQVVRGIQSAKTLRDVKLVFESALSILSDNRRITEQRTQGNSSRVTRPASTPVVSEGYEVNRWSKLAGIIKG